MSDQYSVIPSASVLEDEEGVLDVAYDEEVLPARFDLTSYGADFLVDGLINRLNTKDIFIPTFDPEVESTTGVQGFQRRFVWTKPQCDKFIESLLLGLPVPEVFLVRQPDNVLLVLDGQQRLRTIQAFRKGLLRGREFRLHYVQEPFTGAMYADLDPEDRRHFDNSIIHATVLRPEADPRNVEAIYLAFERINSGGTPLHPHEIRIALSRGSLIELLRDLNKEDAWRSLYGTPSNRFKDQELILRFLALLERGDDYERPMKGFLNQFAHDYRNPGQEVLQRFSGIFTVTVELVHTHIGTSAFRPVKALNAAVVDSLMVGIARMVERGGELPAATFRQRYESLLSDSDYRASVERATADEASVATRLRLATEAFT